MNRHLRAQQSFKPGDPVTFTRSGRGAKQGPLEGVVVYYGPRDSADRREAVEGYKPYLRSFDPHKASPEHPRPECLVDSNGRLYRPRLDTIKPLDRD